MSNYCFDLKPVTGIRDLCGEMKGKALQSPYRSTVPLLDLVENSPTEWRNLLESWGAPRQASVHIEFRVSSPKSGGNPSQTDAVLMSGTGIWAIEAKWTEPRYETVASRIREPESDGGDPQITVNGWLARLQPFAKRDLKIEDTLDVVYQVLHRAASACSIATERKLQPELVYLHFHPSPLPSSATTAQYIADLRHLHALMGNPGSVKFTVVELPLEPTAEFEKIKGLDKHLPSTAEQVTAALCSGPLFTFGAPSATRI